MTREELLDKAVGLLQVHRTKTKALEQEGKLSPGCGTITRAACQFAALFPSIRDAGITADEIDAELRRREEHEQRALSVSE